MLQGSLEAFYYRAVVIIGEDAYTGDGVIRRSDKPLEFDQGVYQIGLV